MYKKETFNPADSLLRKLDYIIKEEKSNILAFIFLLKKSSAI
jgi:hypothetical protein